MSEGKEEAIEMTPDEVVEAVKKLGIEVTRRTLLNYEKWNLVPKAERGGAGQGKGRTTDYPDETPAEFYASLALKKETGLKLEHIATCREKALHGTDDECDDWLSRKWLAYKRLMLRAMMDKKEKIEKVKKIDEERPLLLVGTHFYASFYPWSEMSYNHYKDKLGATEDAGSFEDFLDGIIRLAEADKNSRERILNTIFRAKELKQAYWISSEEKKCFKDVEILLNHDGKFARFLRWAYL